MPIPTTVQGRSTVMVGQVERRQARDLLEALDGRLDALVVDGAEGLDRLPVELRELLGKVMVTLANGGAVLIGSMPEELSTTAAAEQLGLSRPTLMKMIRGGEIPSHMVGSHHRLRTQDVLDHKRARLEKQRRALEELMELEDELDWS